MRNLKITVIFFLFTIGSSLAPDLRTSPSLLSISSRLRGSARTPAVPARTPAVPARMPNFPPGFIQNVILKLDGNELSVDDLNRLYPELVDLNNPLELKEEVVLSLITSGVFDSGSPVTLTLSDMASREQLRGDIHSRTDVNITKQTDGLRQAIKDSEQKIRNLVSKKDETGDGRTSEMYLTGSISYNRAYGIYSYNHYEYIKKVLETPDGVGRTYQFRPDSYRHIAPVAPAAPASVQIKIKISRQSDGNYQAHTINPDVESLIDEIDKNISTTNPDPRPKILVWNINAPTGSVYRDVESLREWITESIICDRLFDRDGLLRHNIYMSSESKKWENAVKVTEKEGERGTYEVLVTIPAQATTDAVPHRVSSDGFADKNVVASERVVDAPKVCVGRPVGPTFDRDLVNPGEPIYYAGTTKTSL